MKLQLSEAIKTARLKSGISQSTLAKQLGYNNSQFVSNWERGTVNIPMKKMTMLVEILKLDWTDVLKMMRHDAIVLMERKLKK